MAARPGVVGSFWPSAQQELLLRAALLDQERSEQAWQLLKPSLDIQRLERGSVVLLPLLYEKLQERGSTEAFVPRLKGVYRQVWYRNQLGLDVLQDVLSALGAAGVEAIVVGEGALIARYYQRLGVRPLDRPSVLVRPDRAAAALDALARSGWDASPRGSDRWREVERAGPGNRRSCAVYWRALGELELSTDLDGARFWDAASPTEVRGVQTSTLGSTHELLWACLGGARTGSTSRVQWVADALTILQVAGSDVDWEKLVAEAVALGWALRLRDALAYLAAALEAPVPQTALRELEDTPSGGRERLAQRIAGHGGTLLGNLPATVAVHVVATRDQRMLRSALTLPLALRREWGLDHVGQLPAAAARRGAAVVAAARARRHAH
jgi:hypothetical protein